MSDSYSRPQTRESVESVKKRLEYESFEYESRLDTALLKSARERRKKEKRKIELKKRQTDRKSILARGCVRLTDLDRRPRSLPITVGGHPLHLETPGWTGSALGLVMLAVAATTEEDTAAE